MSCFQISGKPNERAGKYADVLKCYKRLTQKGSKIINISKLQVAPRCFKFFREPDIGERNAEMKDLKDDHSNGA